MIYKLNTIKVVDKLVPDTFYRLVWPKHNVNYIVKYTGYKDLDNDPTLLCIIIMSNDESTIREKRPGINLRWGIGKGYEDGSYLETIEED